jgi:hypothetical protein
MRNCPEMRADMFYGYGVLSRFFYDQPKWFSHPVKPSKNAAISQVFQCSVLPTSIHPYKIFVNGFAILGLYRATEIVAPGDA